MAGMQKVSIEALARQQLQLATANNRNAADTVVGRMQPPHNRG